jgi:energy-coupling factor transport system permease protein
MPPLHPTTRILLWVFLAVALSWLQTPALLGLGAALALALALAGAQTFVRLLRRARFLLVSLVVIYALSFPGQLVWPGLGALSPTEEGVRVGIVQAWKLILLLAGLGLLHARCGRECLLAGILGFLWPLRRLGIDARRAAARMALTLEYAEDAARWTRQEWKRLLAGGIEDEATSEPVRIKVALAPPGRVDVLALALWGALLAALMPW